MSKPGRLLATVRHSVALSGLITIAVGAFGQAVPTATTTASSSTTPSDEVVALSPFEVVSDTKGYYSPNTMSGTRFNTRLEDLAAPITVITKEQMQDFAMLDINDIFQYAANTEGTGTFTDMVIDRNGSISDNVQNSPNTANRIRGLQSANISFNNFEMSGRMPVDPSVTNGVEISRGPNANVFGLGNPSGTVNQVAAAANLSRNRAEAQFRADSYDGWRTSLDVNRVLKPGVLAVRGSAVYQRDGFVRKPSGMDTERYNGMIKYQPFKNTTITGGLYYFHQYGNRPNFVPPRDSVSYWVSQGKPTWDPIDEVVHVNGQTLGPFTVDTNVPDGIQRSFTGNNHSYLYIDKGAVGYFQAPTTTALVNNALSPNGGGQSVRLFVSNSAAGANTTGNLGKIGGQPLFVTTPSVTNKALYDWTDVNIAAPNLDWDRDLVSNVQLDQVFLNTPRQTLAAQIAFMREDSNRYRRDYLGGVANDNGQSGQLFVDVNEKNIDGSPNPYLGRLFLAQDQPRTTYQPLKWDSYRAQLAYKLDFTKENGLLKWLGSHQFAGYDEYKYRITRRYSFREAMLDPKPWIPATTTSRGNQGAIVNGPTAALAITRSYLRYYVGEPNSLHVDYAPSNFSAGTYPFSYGTYTFANRTVNGQTASLPVAGSGQFVREPTQVGLAAVTDSTGAGSNTKTILKTMGGILQSHFLDERLVTTFGLREDKQYVKNGSAPQLLNADGTTFNYDSIDHWAAGDYKFNSGRTKQGGAVVRPFLGASFLRGMDESGPLGHFFASAAKGAFFTYNKSDSFLPQDPKINLFFQSLPNTTGHGKDYGMGFNLFDGQLVVRYNHYETKTINFRQGDASTIAQRVTRIDIASTGAFLLYNQAYSPTALTNNGAGSTIGNTIGWVRVAHPAFTEAQVQAEVGRQMGLPYDQIIAIQSAFNAGTIASTQDVVAKGDELEINYVSPSRNWTVAANATQTQAYNQNISNDIQQWIDQRMPIWTTVRDERTGKLWWNNTDYGGSQTAAQNFDSFVRVPYSVVKAKEGKSNPQISRYNWRVSTNYRLAGITENKYLKRVSVGGALRWQSPAAINYYGIKDATGTYVSLDPTKPIYDKAHMYADAFVSYQTKLWADKVGARFQLNVVNLQESGRLQPIDAYPDGTPTAYRIVDPRKFIFTVTFDL